MTVLFCDLRGFSQKAEAAAGDLRGLLDRVSRALGIDDQPNPETRRGDGRLSGGCSNGLLGLALRVARMLPWRRAGRPGIALAFGQTFGRPDHPLGSFQVGIGVAHGRAVAGKIGTAEQVKVTVFGPVVNLASRLEGMTKQLRVPIVLDEATASIVNARMDRNEGRTRGWPACFPTARKRLFWSASFCLLIGKSRT